MAVHLLPLAQRAVAVVGGEIHHLDAPLEQGRHEAGGQATGQAQQGQVGHGRNGVWIRALHHRIARQGQERHKLAPAFAGTALAT